MDSCGDVPKHSSQGEPILSRWSLSVKMFCDAWARVIRLRETKF
jgi:hypothetical protein